MKKSERIKEVINEYDNLCIEIENIKHQIKLQEDTNGNEFMKQLYTILLYYKEIEISEFEEANSDIISDYNYCVKNK